MTGFSFQTDLNGKFRDEKDIEYTSTSPEATGQIYEVLQQFFEIFGLQDNDF